MSIKDSQRLKSLQSRSAILSQECSNLSHRVKQLQDEWSKKLSQLKAMESEIAQICRKDPIVSEHALIRYLERAMDLDLEQLKSEILTPEVTKQIKIMGNGKFPLGNGLRVVVKDNVVTTVV